MKKNFVHTILNLTLLVLIAFIAPMGALAFFTPSDGQDAALVLGQSNFTSNTPASSQNGMRLPNTIAVNPYYTKVFVADTENNRVLRFSSVTHLLNGSQAEAVLGQANFTGDDPNRGGAVAANTMNYPTGVFLDYQGRLWVADKFNHRVLRFDNACTKANGANADGVLGQANFLLNLSNRGGAVAANTMYSPHGVFVDLSGRLWISESQNHRVLRFDAAAGKSDGANADGVLGQPGFTSNTPATSRDGMAGPVGLTGGATPGELWVLEWANSRALRFNQAATKANGADADGVLGQPDFTHNVTSCTKSGLHFPWGIGKGSEGELYIADSNNNRVLIFNHAAKLGDGSPADYVLGQPDFTTCTEGVSATKMNDAAGVIYDFYHDLLWVTDRENHRVLVFGVLDHWASTVLGQADFTSNFPNTASISMESPVGVAVDPTTRKVFVADFGNSRVLRFASAYSLSNGSAAEAVLGQVDFDHGNPNQGGAVTASSLYAPYGLSVDQAGRLWVADSYNNRVLRFDGAATKSNGANADGVLGQSNFSTNQPNRGGAVDVNTLYLPVGVFVDSGGRLWVSDHANNRVLRFENAATKTDGAGADGVLGQANFSTNNAVTSRSGINRPIGLYVESEGVLWIADLYNDRVLRFDNAAGKPNGGDADLVLGQPDFETEGSACTPSGMNGPQGVSGGDVLGGPLVDSSIDIHGLQGVSGVPYSELFVTDSNNNRVLIFMNNSEMANGDNAKNVIGQPDEETCTQNTGGVSRQSLFFPAGVFFDRMFDLLWVGDTKNHRVLAYGIPRAEYVFLPIVIK